MNIQKAVFDVVEKGTSTRVVTTLINMALRNPRTRKALLRATEKAIYRAAMNGPSRPRRVYLDRYYLGRALLNSIHRAFSSGHLSSEVINKLAHVFFGKILLTGIHTRRKFFKEHGFQPPSFITISPTNICNLKCIGCYAGEVYEKHTLDYDIFNRIIQDMKKEFAAYFFVISGGEPFMYKSKGKNLLNILEENQDAYFMGYTNGTLINKEIAKRLAQLGNFTPVISVKGFEKETDGRRGKGTFKKIMQAMDYLKEEGVLFGISVTPCRHNADLLLSDEFIDFYFNKKGVFYIWYFQYMPIGRKPTMDLMVTPEQRINMYHRIWHLVINERLFLADFWDSGTASDGCMSAARGGGYFYILWDGTITPCVFIPFKDRRYGNIYEVYNRGETLTDVIKSPFFTAIRKWQCHYWMEQPPEKCGNLLAPCIIRDNCRVFYKIVKAVGAEPIDEGAKEYLKLVETGALPKYNDEYRKLADPIWEKEFLQEKEIKEEIAI